MQLRELVTYSFARNVGGADRLIRVLFGTTLAASPWLLAMPRGVGYIAALIGLVTVTTGLVSRCALYYMLGISTCPAGSKHQGITE